MLEPFKAVYGPLWKNQGHTRRVVHTPMPAPLREGDFAPPPLLLGEALVFPLQVTSPRADTPEQALLRAVLDDCLLCLQRSARLRATSARHARLFGEEWSWLMSDDPLYFCGFLSICHHLDLSPQWIRAGVQALLARTARAPWRHRYVTARTHVSRATDMRKL